MRKNYFIFAIAIMCMACSKQVEDNTDPSLSIIPQGVAIAEDYRLSPMNIAEYVELQATTMNVTTRAIRGMDVKAVMRSEISSDDIQSMSSMEDTVLYIVNFAGHKGGYMVLSNDVRVPILAFSDEGSIDNLEDNPGIMVLMQNYDGFVSTAIEKYNYIADSLDAKDRQKSATRIVSPNEPNKIPPFFMAQFVGYDSRFAPITDMPEKKDKLLAMHWHQSSPFNDNMNFCRVCQTNYPAGCMTIAAAQILAYKNAIKRSKDGSIGYDWRYNTQLTDESVFNPRVTAEIKTFVKEVADMLGVRGQHNGEDGDFSSPAGRGYYEQAKAILKLEDHGITAMLWNQPYYDRDGWIREEVMSSLRCNNPVYATGISTTTAHAWVIDGYRQTPRLYKDIYEKWLLLDGTFYYRYYETRLHMDRTTSYHCNWGWERINVNGMRQTYNGYYNEGVFDRHNTQGYDPGIRTSSASNKVTDYNFSGEVRVTLNLRAVN